MITQDKFSYLREWGVTFDETINGVLAFSIHCTTYSDEDSDEVTNEMYTWIIAKDDRRYDLLYKQIPFLKPDDDEMMNYGTYALWSNWEAAY